MLARWKVVVMARRKKLRDGQDGDDGQAMVCTPRAPPPQQIKRDRYSSELSGSDKESLLSGENESRRSESTATDWRKQTLLQRVLAEKNRLVQRTLVMLRLAKASEDVYFKKKQNEYDQAIQQLQATKEIIELYALSLLDLNAAMRGFAGNSSDVRSRDHAEVSASGSFLLAMETFEETGHQFMEQVQERILRSMDDRIEDLQLVSKMLGDRADLQIDVDYAKRTLFVAQQRGDVNQIADKKRALRMAHLRRGEATKKIAQLLRHYDDKQEIEFDLIVTEFACITKQFFVQGASILRAADSSPPRRSMGRSARRRPSQSDTSRDPIAV